MFSHLDFGVKESTTLIFFWQKSDTMKGVNPLLSFSYRDLIDARVVKNLNLFHLLLVSFRHFKGRDNLKT